jgi:hypothetical protein
MPQSRFKCFRERKNLLSLPGIKPQFPAHSLVTILCYPSSTISKQFLTHRHHKINKYIDNNISVKHKSVTCMVCMYICKHFGMDNIKFIASQAKSINLYKNTRSKLLKCCANIYFNRQCIAKKVIPKYASIRFVVFD